MRGETSARPGKRPLRALSASEKMDAIQRVHEGESKASVARDIGVPESTLRGWCKSEHKIRGMARNSSTPDSEAHSPASSSGTNIANMTAANLSSEDEGGPAMKKMKMVDSQTSAASYLDESDKDKLRIHEYLGLMSMAGMRPDATSTLLLQQLGMMSASANKGLLGLPGLGNSAVGLVENGLQYTKGSTSKRHSLSAIAPMQQLDLSKSGSRKSLPPAAEAPSTPVPASPRKTNNEHLLSSSTAKHTSSSSSIMGTSSSTSNGHKRQQDTTSSSKVTDESLWLWLTQQQQLLGQQSVQFNPGQNDGSWFWQWYKNCTYPGMANSTSVQQQQQQQQQHQQQQAAVQQQQQPPAAHKPVATHQVASVKKSPSKAKAALDNVLCNNNNNNNENLERNENESLKSDNGENSRITSDEAIEHGDKFFEWLDKCSDPMVTRLQIMQFKYLLDNLKSKKISSSNKHSRKCTERKKFLH